MKTPIWEYNGKFYLGINAVRIKEAQVENGFKKDVPYIMGLSFSKYDFQKMASRLQVIQFPKIINLLNTNI